MISKSAGDQLSFWTISKNFIWSFWTLLKINSNILALKNPAPVAGNVGNFSQSLIYLNSHAFFLLNIIWRFMTKQTQGQAAVPITAPYWDKQTWFPQFIKLMLYHVSLTNRRHGVKQDTRVRLKVMNNFIKSNFI